MTLVALLTVALVVLKILGYLATMSWWIIVFTPIWASLAIWLSTTLFVLFLAAIALLVAYGLEGYMYVKRSYVQWNKGFK